MNAGPVYSGLTPNMVVRIIVDPENKIFESHIAPACLYVALSCATTMGDMDDIYKLNSGIYFQGENITIKNDKNGKKAGWFTHQTNSP